MPDATFHVELIAPQGRLVSIEALYLDLPGEDGRLAIMAGHQPAIIGMTAGLLTLRDASGKTSEWSIGRGHTTITPQGVTIITRDATLQD
jgi:F-type H+-transporting ATPase subunit epsilon